MARLFDDGSSQYLDYGGVVVSAEPITMAAWFYSDDDTIIQNILSINDASSDRGWNLQARGNVAGDPVAWYVRGDTTLVAPQTTTGYSVNTWHHACGVSAADNSHWVWIDGGSINSSAVDIGLASGLDVTVIGAHANFATHNKCMSGRIAEAAIWNINLLGPEVAALATGISPLAIRPGNLVAYWPLIRDNDIDWVGGYDMTDHNNPTIAAHAPVMYVTRPIGMGVPLGVISGTTCWGHDTGVTETNIRDFSGNWTGTGSIAGAGDGETIELDGGENMVSEVVETGNMIVQLLQNEYDITGDDVTLKYRHGATIAACQAAAWNNYTIPFASLGYVQVRLEN